MQVRSIRSATPLNFAKANRHDDENSGDCRSAGAVREPDGLIFRLVPKTAIQLSPKPPYAEPRIFAFRFYEAAVRGLTRSAISCPWRLHLNFSCSADSNGGFSAIRLIVKISAPGHYAQFPVMNSCGADRDIARALGGCAMPAAFT